MTNHKLSTILVYEKKSLYNPNRNEIEIAVAKFLENGGNIKKIKYNENLPDVNEIIRSLERGKTKKMK